MKAIAGSRTFQSVINKVYDNSYPDERWEDELYDMAATLGLDYEMDGEAIVLWDDMSDAAQPPCIVITRGNFLNTGSGIYQARIGAWSVKLYLAGANDNAVARKRETPFIWVEDQGRVLLY